MLSAEPMALPESAVAEAKAYLRVAGSDEDALIGRALSAAAELCELFTGQALLARAFAEALPASTAWARLGATPVRAIDAVVALPAGGGPVALASDAYAIDIDAAGDGWVRLLDAGEAAQVRVGFEAGLAETWEAVPDALRQGAVRLAAHLYLHRDIAGDAPPPTAVTALWRPWRRMRL